MKKFLWKFKAFLWMKYYTGLQLSLCWDITEDLYQQSENSYSPQCMVLEELSYWGE